MAYTQEPARFAEQIAAARDIAGGSAVWAGIGAYRLTPAQTIENIQAARTARHRRLRALLLRQPHRPEAAPPDYLDVVSRAAFGSRSAHITEAAILRSRPTRIFHARRGSIAIGDRARTRSPPPSIEVGRRDRVLWRDAFGRLTYAADAPPATDDTIFDLASLTKVIATATLVDARRRRRIARARRSRRRDRLPAWRGADRERSPSRSARARRRA